MSLQAVFSSRVSQPVKNRCVQLQAGTTRNTWSAKKREDLHLYNFTGNLVLITNLSLLCFLPHLVELSVVT